jgi:glyoxylase-like metal-dependent hydrolase (beta-lactamase superfamily II)
MTASRRVPRVKVLKEGSIVREGDRIVDASSSVTLIEAGGRLVVVDTGSPRDEKLLAKLLGDVRVAPGDIEYVVNTHMHIDHAGCNEMFKNARLVAHELEDPPAGTIRIKGAADLLPGVRIVPTPGHTHGSISVFVSGDKDCAICGDALPTRDNYLKHAPPSINVNPRLALRSMDMIIEWADEVVPGHDKPFEVLGKKYDA